MRAIATDEDSTASKIDAACDATDPSPSSTADTASDEALLTRIAAGDQGALGELYDRYASPVHSLARHICGDEDTAEDVTCRVFLDAWRRPARIDLARHGAQVWLLASACHHAVDALRRDAAAHSARPPARTRHDPSDGPGAGPGGLGSVIARHLGDPISQLSSRGRLDGIHDTALGRARRYWISTTSLRTEP